MDTFMILLSMLFLVESITVDQSIRPSKDICLYSFQIPQCPNTDNSTGVSPEEATKDVNTLQTLTKLIEGQLQSTNSSTSPVNCPAPGTAESYPPQCCSFPYTYNNRLYYSCTPQSNGNPVLGCYMSQRIWVNCKEPSDYVAQPMIVDITIPTSPPTTMTVTSVNNWIIFQQRLDDSVDFNRLWNEYKTGFGDYNGNFWMGLENVYQLCNSGMCSLRIEALLVSGLWYSEEYNIFFLEGENANYKIHVAGISGDGDKIMVPSRTNGLFNGMSFTTRDVDNDLRFQGSCAAIFLGGWWYNNCFWINLNGGYNSFGFSVDNGNSMLQVSRMMLKLM